MTDNSGTWRADQPLTLVDPMLLNPYSSSRDGLSFKGVTSVAFEVSSLPGFPRSLGLRYPEGFAIVVTGVQMYYPFDGGGVWVAEVRFDAFQTKRVVLALL